MQGAPNHPRGLTKLALAMTPELRAILRSYTENWIDTYDLLQELLPSFQAVAGTILWRRASAFANWRTVYAGGGVAQPAAL